MIQSDPSLHWLVEEQSGERLDRWIAARLPDRARNRIQNDIEAGRVRVNGAPQPARHRVRAGERIEYGIPEDIDRTPQPEPIPLSIVHEDEHLLVIDKPAGLVVHPAPGHAGGTLVNALLAHCGPSLEGVGGEGRWGIVHRLDALTSGLILAARTPAAYEALVEALAARRVRRQYLGIAVGRFKEAAGTIDRPIGRRPRDRKRMGVVKEEKGGRAAQTDWRVLAQDHSLALLALTLQTGRTHQIRVHLSSIGRPVLGDAEYGWTKPRTLQAMPQSFRPALASVWPARQMLHAARLTLEHPIAGDLRIDVHSRPPDDMARVLNAAFGNAWRPAVDDWFTEPVDAHGRSGLNGHDSQDDEEGPALQEPLDAD